MAELNKFIGDQTKRVKTKDARANVKNASDADLQGVLHDVQRELIDQRTQAMMQQIANPMRIRALKKLVARVYTEISAREQKAA